MQLDVQLFGGFQLLARPGLPIVLANRKAQALLAYLAMRPGYYYSRDKLAALLWGDRGEQQARHSLRQTLVAIRKALPPEVSNVIGGDGGAICLDRSAQVDVIRFEQLAGEPSNTSMRKAVALYQGPLLDGLTVNEESFEDWLLIERERLRAICMEVLSRLLRYYASEGDPELGVHAAVKLLSLDPLQESVHRTLMRLYLKLGRREAALRQYRMCVHLLKRELGTDPEIETRDAYREILNLPATVRQAEQRMEEESPSARRSILVVDDDVVTRALIEGFLEEDGYEVVQAQDGAEALLQLGRRHFSLVLLDLNMPTLDGFKLLEIMGAKAIKPPTICLTALSGDEFEVAGFKLGAIDFIRKPVRREVLQLRIRNALKARAELPASGTG